MVWIANQCCVDDVKDTHTNFMFILSLNSTIYSTEYSANFVSPVGLKCVGGAWEDAPQPDLLLHVSNTVINKI